MIVVAPTAPGSLLIESCCDVLEEHESMIAQRPMDLILGQPSKVQVANLFAKPIFFIKNMVVACTPKPLEYIVHLLGEEAIPKRQKRALAQVIGVLLQKLYKKYVCNAEEKIDERKFDATNTWNRPKT